MRWLCLREDGGLRAGWRVLAHGPMVVAALVVTLLAAVVVSVGTEAAGLELTPRVTTTLQLVLMSVALVTIGAAHAVSGWVLDARFAGGFRPGRVRGSGLGGPLLRSLAELVGGAGVGLVALLPALAVLAATGLAVEPAPLTADLLVGFTIGSLMLAPSAAVEELLFRGYGALWLGRALSALAALAVPQRVADGLGFGLVVGGLSLLFGLAHLGNPGASAFGTVNTLLAGLWLGVMVLRTRSLWVAIGAHWSWNWGHGLVLGLPLSGATTESSGMELATLLTTRSTAEAAWLNGGDYGLEGSVAATVAHCAMC